jgi:hypothetical protein
MPEDSSGTVATGYPPNLYDKRSNSHLVFYMRYNAPGKELCSDGRYIFCRLALSGHRSRPLFCSNASNEKYRHSKPRSPETP